MKLRKSNIIRRKNRIRFLAPATGFLAAFPALATNLAAQCAMCRTALTNSPEGQRWAHGINAGIFLLLAAPLLIVASMAFVAFRPRIFAALSILRDKTVAFLPAFGRRTQSPLARSAEESRRPVV